MNVMDVMFNTIAEKNSPSERIEMAQRLIRVARGESEAHRRARRAGLRLLAAAVVSKDRKPFYVRDGQVHFADGVTLS